MPPETLRPGKFRAGGSRPPAGEARPAGLRRDLDATTEGARSCSTI
jgi:hypothetical protein